VAVTLLNPQNEVFSVSTATTLRDGLKPCRGFAYRSTGTGALTLTIVYSPATKEVVRPHMVELSKSGNHGFHIYCLPPEAWSELWVVRLEVSNSGKRYITFSRNVPQDIAQKITAQWLAGATIDTIIKTLRST
jgi:hypothetical protein